MSRGRKVLAASGAVLAIALTFGTFAWYLPLRTLVDIGAADTERQAERRKNLLAPRR